MFAITALVSVCTWAAPKVRIQQLMTGFASEFEQW